MSHPAARGPRYRQLPLWRDAQRFLLEVELAVCAFPRYHKYTLGSDLRRQAMDVNRLVAGRRRAARGPAGAPGVAGGGLEDERAARQGVAGIRVIRPVSTPGRTGRGAGQTERGVVQKGAVRSGAGIPAGSRRRVNRHHCAPTPPAQGIPRAGAALAPALRCPLSYPWDGRGANKWVGHRLRLSGRARPWLAIRTTRGT